jgi:membrane protein implicated in regulation of membrane protease activity
MSELWMWWIAAAVLIGAELVTGTFYLLAVGLAVAIGGLAGLARLLAPGASSRGRDRRRRAHGRPRTNGGGATPRPAPQPVAGRRAVGARARVEAPTAPARVSYRGSTWTAKLATPDTRRDETMYIVGTNGSILVVSDRRA